MSEYYFCILGTENSGKSSYVSKISTNSLSINSNNFSIWYDKSNINDSYKTDKNLYHSNKYYLKYNGENVFDFYVNDYSGTILKDRNESSVYNLFQEDIKKANFLLIFIDGSFFNEESKEAVLKTLKRKCVRMVNPCITYCSEQHNDILPPLLFVITKSDTFINKYNKQDINDIIIEAFNGSFPDDVQKFVICIDTVSDRAVKIPLFTALNYAMNVESVRFNDNIKEKNKRLNAQIADKQNFLRTQEERLILKNPFKMKQAREDIAALSLQVNNNNTQLANSMKFKQEKEFKEVFSNEVSLSAKNAVYGYDDYIHEIQQNKGCMNPVLKFILIAAALLFGFNILKGIIIALIFG